MWCERRIGELFEIDKALLDQHSFPTLIRVYKINGSCSSRKIQNNFDDNYKFMITVSKSTFINVMNALDVTGYEFLL